jgi:hypothetical protein
VRANILWLAPIVAGSALAGVAPCTQNLVPCNYADQFTGTIHQRVETNTTAQSDPAGKARQRVDEYDVTVTDGRATCTGKLDGRPVQGAGLIAVERGSTWYSILVACPDENGALPGIDDAQIRTDRQDDVTGFLKLDAKLGDDTDAGGVTTIKRADWSLVRRGGGAP